MKTEYSVGLPVRNEQETIVQTIDSILNQTVQPKEIHVCVNGSTDKTYEYVSDIALAEKNINLINSEPGKANAWKKIVSDSSTNEIMFCDGDVIINSEAAESMLNTLDEKSDLILVGGANAYHTASKTTFFSQYFTENLNGNPIKQDWVCGRLYMTKIKELHDLSKKLEIELMPSNTINEDGYLEMITSGHREIIDSAYNISTQVSTFHDWKIGFKRILAGQRQLKQNYPHLFGDTDLSLKRLKNYASRFNQIEKWSKKIGVTSLFFLRIGLNVYYKASDKLDYNPQWTETKTTKVRINI